MNEIAMIAAICIICAIVCKFFETNSREFQPLVSICACAVGFAAVSTMLTPICEFIETMMQNAGADEKYTVIIFKSAAISIIAQLGADICRDARETALASVVEAAGKISLAAMSVSLLAEIALTVTELTG